MCNIKKTYLHYDSVNIKTKRSDCMNKSLGQCLSTRDRDTVLYSYVQTFDHPCSQQDININIYEEKLETETCVSYSFCVYVSISYSIN